MRLRPLLEEGTGLSPPIREPLTRTSPAQPYGAPVSQGGSGGLTQNKDFPPLTSDAFAAQKDTSAYVKSPDTQFQRPWLAIPGKKRFVWPLGVQGFHISLKPDLGIHKYLGNNNVEVDVLHVGEEHIQMTGKFIGKTSAAAMRALRDICEQPSPERGKILHLPGVLPKYQYVFVEEFDADYAQDSPIGSQDIAYTISFVKATTAKKVNLPKITEETHGPHGINADRADRANPGNVFYATEIVNTARKVAAVVYGSEDLWPKIADNNMAAIMASNIPMALVPDFRLAVGLAVYY